MVSLTGAYLVAHPRISLKAYSAISLLVYLSKWRPLLSYVCLSPYCTILVTMGTCGLSKNSHVLWDHRYVHTQAHTCKKKKKSNTVGTGALICCTLRYKRK